MQLDISFIIIEYHSIDDIMQCVKNIDNYCQKLKYEIIISSNSCYNDDTQNKIQDQLPDCRILFNAVNGGFAYAMNSGLRTAQGKACVIMNPDVRLLNENMYDAYKLLMNNRNIGVIGPKIVNRSGIVQDSIRKFPTPFSLIARNYKKRSKRILSVNCEHYDLNTAQAVDWVIGAFMFFRRNLIDSVGYLDESYFMYIEDLDFCTRVWKTKYEVHYYPHLVVEYEGDRKSNIIFSGSNLINIYTLFHIKGYIKYFIKNYLG